MSTRQYATFHLDRMLFGVNVLEVQEVLRYHEMTRVPLAPVIVEGLINLRGQIVTAIDMRRRLRLPERAEGAQPMNMIVRSEDGAVSLLVDEIGDVIEVNESCFAAPPSNMPSFQRQLIGSVCKLQDKLLLVLDTERTLRIQADSELKD